MVISSSSPVGRPMSRVKRFSAELVNVCGQLDARELMALGRHIPADFGSAAGNRVKSVVNTLVRLAEWGEGEGSSLVTAARKGRTREHAGERIRAAGDGIVDGWRRLKGWTTDTHSSLQRNPTETLVTMCSTAVVALLASGGVDGDGGLPDTDLLIGIDVHRSPLTHSIILTSALEASLLMLMRLTACAYTKLPSDHDPLWDSLYRHGQGILAATARGASIGVAYHLMVDSLIQPAPYHGLPFSMPIEFHQTLMGLNSMAEAGGGGQLRLKFNELPDNAAKYAYCKQRRVKIPKVYQTRLVVDDVDLLEKYGFLLYALASKAIEPTTSRQAQFVAFVHGDAAAQTRSDNAWRNLMNVVGEVNSKTGSTKEFL